MSYNLTLFQPTKQWISGNETDYLSYEGFLAWTRQTPQIVAQSVNFTWESSDRVIINIDTTNIPNPFQTAIIAVNYKGVNFWFDVVDFKPLTQEILQVTGTLNIYYSFLVKEFKENNSSDQRLAFFDKKHCNRCVNGVTNIVKQPWLYRLPKELETLNTLDVSQVQYNIQQVNQPTSYTMNVTVFQNQTSPTTITIDMTLNAKWNTAGTQIIGYMYAVIKMSPTQSGSGSNPPYALAPIPMVNPSTLSFPMNSQYFLNMSDVNTLGSNILQVIMLPFSMFDLGNYVKAGGQGTPQSYWTYTNLNPSNFPSITTAGTLYILPYNLNLQTFQNDLPIFQEVIAQPYVNANFLPNLPIYEPLINQVTQKVEMSNGIDTIDLDLQNVSNNNPPVVIPNWEMNLNTPQIAYYLPKPYMVDWYVQYQYNQGGNNEYFPQMSHKSFFTEISLPSLATNWADYIQQHQISYNNSKILAILGLALSPLNALHLGISNFDKNDAKKSAFGLWGNLGGLGGNLASEGVNLHYLESGMRKDETRTGNLRQSIEKNAFVNGGVLLTYTVKRTNTFNQNAIFKQIALFGYEYGNYTLFRSWYNRKIFNWVQMDYVIKDLGINVNKTFASEIAGLLKKGIRIWTFQSVINGQYGNGLNPQVIYENMEVTINEPQETI